MITRIRLSDPNILICRGRHPGEEVSTVDRENPPPHRHPRQCPTPTSPAQPSTVAKKHKIPPPPLRPRWMVDLYKGRGGGGDRAIVF